MGRTWVRIDDTLPTNGKVWPLSLAAKWAYVSSICYSSKNLTDGVVPATDLGSVNASPKIAKELVEAGLWEPVTVGKAGAFYVHDYLLYNRSKAQIESRGDTYRRNGVKGRAAQLAGQTSGQFAEQFDLSVCDRDVSPENSSPGVPTDNTGNLPGNLPEGAAAVAFDALSAAGISLNRRQQEDVADLILDDGYEAAWFAKAAAVARTKGVSNWPYVKAILDGWRQNGAPEERRNGTRSAAPKAGGVLERLAATGDYVEG